MSTLALLFVYGTLKRGGALHDELIGQGAIFLGVARARGQLFRSNLHRAFFPYSIPRSPDPSRKRSMIVSVSRPNAPI
jgi:gamma-glutamylcyclotransferase (GGCT)/AIG2-like uncharacterized protein YtfP